MRERTASGGYSGVLNVVVEAGHSWLCTSDCLPWNLEPPRDEDLRLLHTVARLADKERRVTAASASEVAGVYEGVDGERVLSVRLNDACDHRESSWEERACGHKWCRHAHLVF